MNSSSLSSCIVKSLKQREMASELTSLLLNSSRTEVLRRDETEYWDYKETIDLDNPLEVAKLAKRVLAFHNCKGGTIIYGVRDNYSVSGINSSQVLDTNQINQKLRQYIGTTFSLFQDTIPVTQNKLIWLVFVPSKQDVPVAVLSNGPLNKKNQNEIKRGEFYVRVNDEVKLCSEPNEIYRLLGNVSLSHIEAYLYDVDEPYFRLLTPHCERFVGRKKQLNTVREALFKARHPIIALDGMGGVGKSAVAIEIVRSLYDAQKYMFIVSQSAKSKVWHEHIATRKAGFSGLTEFLQGIAKVLDLPREDDLDQLKDNIVKAMEGLEGLLVVDNLEDITDEAVFSFLIYDVPHPVKVLVTSRVDKGLGALTISIPQMDEPEARELLYEELNRVGYKDVYADIDSVNEIIEATGKIPLALKWAALLASSTQSLKEASRKLRTFDAKKKEFLSFCFATMFDVLTPIAKEVAILGKYLENNCNPTILSVILEKPEEDVELALDELKEKGILLDTFSDSRKALTFLTLTEDFLANKWHENKVFREKALQRMRLKNINFNQTDKERYAIVVDEVDRLKSEGKYTEALQKIKIALSLDPNNDFLLFLRGTLLYESGRKSDGLNLMQYVISKNEKKSDFIKQHTYLSVALIEHGTAKTVKEGLRLLDWASQQTSLPREILDILIKTSLETGDYRAISSALYRLSSPSDAVSIIHSIKPYLEDIDFIYRCGSTLPQTFRLALKDDSLTKAQRKEFDLNIRTIEKSLDEGKRFTRASKD